MGTRRENEKKRGKADRRNKHPLIRLRLIDWVNITLGCFAYTAIFYLIREYYGSVALAITLFFVSFATMVAAYIGRISFFETVIGGVVRHYELILLTQHTVMEHIHRENEMLKKELEECDDGEEWKKGKNSEG